MANLFLRKLTKSLSWAVVTVFLAVCVFGLADVEGQLATPASGLTLPNIAGYTFYLDRTPYLPLIKVCRAARISYRWDDLTGKIFLYHKSRYITCVIGEKLVDVNGTVGILNAPPRIFEGALVIPRALIDYAWWKEIRPYPPLAPKEVTVRAVMIDPGHGGKDPGGIGAGGVREKHVVLQVAKRLRKKLQASGINVHMTRTGDRFIPLSERAAMTNRSSADLFISIHANIAKSKWVSGFEVYYSSDPLDDSARAVQMIENAAMGGTKPPNGFSKMTMKDPTLVDLMNTEHRREAIELSRSISISFNKERLIRNRGIKTAGFHVLKWTQRPAILIELGFLSNPREAQRLQDGYYQDRLAKRIAEGVVRFKKEYERTEGFTK